MTQPRQTDRHKLKTFRSGRRNEQQKDPRKKSTTTNKERTREILSGTLLHRELFLPLRASLYDKLSGINAAPQTLTCIQALQSQKPCKCRPNETVTRLEVPKPCIFQRVIKKQPFSRGPKTRKTSRTSAVRTETIPKAAGHSKPPPPLGAF